MDQFLTSFLFPDEAAQITFVPDDASVAREKERLEMAVDGHECPVCGRMFSKKSNLKRHMQQQHDDGAQQQQQRQQQQQQQQRLQHQRTTTSPLMCAKCHKTFAKTFNLNRHRESCGRTKPPKPPVTCTLCQKVFATARQLKVHVKNTHTNTCPKCEKQFNTKENLARHARKHLNNDFLTISEVRTLRRLTGRSLLSKKPQTAAAPARSGSPQPGPSAEPAAAAAAAVPNIDSPGSPDDDDHPQHHRQTIRRVHGDAGVVFTIRPAGAEKNSMLQMFAERRSQLRRNLCAQLTRWNNVRWYISVQARMLRFDSDGNIRDEDRPTFRSSSLILLEESAADEQIDQAYFKANSSLETYCSSSSGWVLDEVLLFEQFVLRYNPLGGHCGDFYLPTELSGTRALITVVGRPANSTDCFIWAVIAAIHHDDDQHTGAVHWTAFQDFRGRYRMPEVVTQGNTAVSLTHIAGFEKANGISVNVFAFEKTIFPLYISKTTTTTAGGGGGGGGVAGRHANLLLLHARDEEADDNVFRHYCAIKDLGKLVYRQTDGHHKLHVCPRCLNTQYTAEDLAKHLELCSALDPLQVRMPENGNRFVRFRNYHRQLEVPFVIVARFECFRMPIYDYAEPTRGMTVRERVHKPCAFAYYRLSVDDSHPRAPTFFVDSDPETVMTRFLSCMKEEQDAALAIMSAVAPMNYCDEGMRNMEASNHNCHICGDHFLPDQRVAVDHDHVSGKIRGRACISCNLNFRTPNHLVIILDDLSSYDGRIIMSAAALHDGARNIRVIPKTIDTYAGIIIDKCRYIDLKSFFKDSLDTLIDGVADEEGGDSFVHTMNYWPPDLAPPLHRVPLCRDYIDGPERLRETSLPPLEAFTDRSEGTSLSPEAYAELQRAWSYLSDKTVAGLLELALVSDCLFTSDIVSRLRKTVMKDLKLDPMNYYTLASFAWDSALRYSDTTLELLTSVDMHLMIENAIRGGLAVVGNPRFAQANNPEMSPGTFQEDQETSYIDFLDFNGLYTSVMGTARLPTHGFRFLSEYEIEHTDFENIPEDSDHGYILGVDLSYPADLHDLHDDFPLAPEHISVSKADLSEYTVQTAKACGIDLDNLPDEKRLCLTLRDKKSYTVHYRNLQFYTKHGLQVTNIHRVLTFVQSPFLQTFMEYTADRRRTAKSPFYKSLWKNISNLVSGKSYENPRNYKDVRICTSEKALLGLVAKPSFECLRVFDNNLTAVQMHRPQVHLNRPITVGFSILELSKLSVYSFFYEFVKPTLVGENDTVSFLAGDTDSFVLKISGVPDLKERYRRNGHMFDFSNLPKDHPLKDNKNRMVPGKVKFELPGHVCTEFVALSPKCYSMKTDQGFKQARKGCSKELRHELYKECLLKGRCHTENVSEIRNYGQQLYQVSVTKKTLNVLDVKRYHFDSVTSVSFGHHSLMNK